MKEIILSNKKEYLFFAVSTIFSIIAIRGFNLLFIYLLILLGLFIFLNKKENFLAFLNIFNLSVLYTSTTPTGYLKMNYHIYYPSILRDSLDIFQKDFTASFTYPYIAFKYISRPLFNSSFISVSEYLNFFVLFFSVFILFLTVLFITREKYIGITLVCFFLISVQYQKYLFFDLLGINKLFNSFINNGDWLLNHIIGLNYKLVDGGFAHYKLISDVWQPQMVSILLLLVVYNFYRGNYDKVFIFLSIVILFNTNNLVPAFLIFLALVLNYKSALWKEIIKPNMKYILILLSVIIFVLSYSFLNLSPSDVNNLREADKIMSEQRIPNHLKANSYITFFNLISLDINNFNLEVGGNYPGDNGFPFELEIFLFYFFIIKYSKSKELNIFFTLTLSFIFVSYFFTFLFPENILSIYMKNFVIWKTSILFPFFGLIFLLNNYSKLINKTFFLSLISLMLIFITTFIPNQISLFTENHNIETTKKYPDTLFIASPYDYGLSFDFFTSTTGNYYAHPYNPDEIISWWKQINYIDKALNNINCGEISKLLIENEASGLIFSNINLIPENIKDCKFDVSNEGLIIVRSN